MTPAPLIDPFVPWLPADTAPAEAPAAGTADQDGPVALAGARLAVKDVIDVQGAPTGSGHPLLLAAAAPAPAHAAAVARLLSAGARYAGKTHTDELAYSLGGTNAHYGTPANPAAPGRLTGGSSSGTAAAVAGGLADVGLGTDTAGSIRVPASYCGLYGLRPTHARADRRGIAPLAPSFDTPALLTRTLPLLTEAAAALLAGTPREDRPVRRVLVPADLWGCAADGVRAALRPARTVSDRRSASRWTRRRCSRTVPRAPTRTPGTPSPWSRRRRCGARTARGCAGPGPSSDPTSPSGWPGPSA